MHRRGPCPVEYITYMQFEQLSLPECYMSVNRGNNCILSRGKVGLVRNILSPGEDMPEKVLVVEWFRGNPESFYTDPLHSSDLRIFRISQLQGDIRTVSIKEVTSSNPILLIGVSYACHKQPGRRQSVKTYTTVL